MKRVSKTIAELCCTIGSTRRRRSIDDSATSAEQGGRERRGRGYFGAIRRLKWSNKPFAVRSDQRCGRSAVGFVSETFPLSHSIFEKSAAGIFERCVASLKINRFFRSLVETSVACLTYPDVASIDCRIWSANVARIRALRSV